MFTQKCNLFVVVYFIFNYFHLCKRYLNISYDYEGTGPGVASCKGQLAKKKLTWSPGDGFFPIKTINLLSLKRRIDSDIKNNFVIMKRER